MTMAAYPRGIAQRLAAYLSNILLGLLFYTSPGSTPLGKGFFALEYGLHLRGVWKPKYEKSDIGCTRKHEIGSNGRTVVALSSKTEDPAQ